MRESHYSSMKQKPYWFSRVLHLVSLCVFSHFKWFFNSQFELKIWEEQGQLRKLLRSSWEAEITSWSLKLWAFGHILSVWGFICEVQRPCLLALKVRSGWVSVCQHSGRFIICLWVGLLSVQLTRTRSSMPRRNKCVVTIQWTKYS